MKRVKVQVIILAAVLMFAFAAGVYADEYRLGPGDVLSVLVWGHEDLGVTVQVRPDGYISVPLAGDLPASGKTTQQLKTDITRALAQYIKDPVVTVLVSSFRTIRVQITGEVKLPGYYEVRNDSRLMDVIGRAGGTLETADLRRVAVTRQLPEGGSTVLKADLQRLMENGDTAQNYRLQDGDIVYVPENQKVLVLGEVRQPGAYVVKDEMTVLDLIAMAQGPAETGDLKRAILTRSVDGKMVEFTIDLDALLASDPDARDMAVRPGDVLFIPPQKDVVVLGEVKVPGAYPVETGKRILDVLAMAGGAKETADLSRVRVTTGDTQEELDLQAALSEDNRDSEENIVVSGGDVVFVPKARRQVAVLGEVTRPGVYEFEQGDRLLDALALAGGATVKADLTQAVVTRAAESEPLVVDLEEIQADKRHRHNVVLTTGDVLYVPRAERQVLILGEVKAPGYYEFEPGDRVLEALAMAHGVSESADLVSATLTRQQDGQYETYALDLNSLLNEGDYTDNRVLKDGDVITVPKANRQVVVLGEVKRPGVYPLEDNRRLLDIIAAAGGVTERARGAVTVKRAGKTAFEVQLTDLLAGKNGGDRENALLRGGDVVIVPEGKVEVLVLGEVARPAAYYVSEGARLLDAIAKAGDTTQKADLSRVTLTRADGTQRVVDLNLLYEDPGHDSNYFVQGGDVIQIPEADRQVLVIGEVYKPGAYEMRKESTVLDAISRAGGATDRADVHQVVVTHRDGSQETVDLKELYDSPANEQNFTVSGGDVVHVPRVDNQMLVIGEVLRPGLYPVEDGDTILEMVAKAGGPTEDADVNQITFSRKAGGEQIVDLQELYDNPHHEANQEVVGGDIIYLPELNRRVVIIGEVRRPGMYKVESGDRVLDVIAQAQGTTDEADLVRVKLTRADGTTVHVDLNKVRDNPGSELNCRVAGGDVIEVPKANRQVLVLGEVRAPGMYEMEEGATVLDAIARAGGATDKGLLEEVSLVRRSDVKPGTTRVDLTMVQAGEESAPKVQGGDVVLVPASLRQILVLGEVRRPGYFSVERGHRVLDALALAGGLTDRADGTQAVLTRQIAGKTEKLQLNLDRLMTNEDGEGNYLLTGGEVLVVPRRDRKVLVLGEVNQPGLYELEDSATLPEVIGMARGIKETADPGRVQLTRHTPAGEVRSVVDLEDLVAGADAREAGPVLTGGEVVFVPESKRKVVVLGEVRRPGTYPFEPGATVLDALSLAGGATDEADLAAVTVTKRSDSGETLSCDLTAVYRGEAPDTELTAGDIVFVPEARSVLVLGEVARPGSYLLPPGAKVLDAIARSGGLTPEANERALTLTRIEEGQELVLSIDYEKLTTVVGSEQNYALRGGDILFVPEAQKQILVLGEVKSPGLHPYRDGMGLLEAIASAGGPTERAALQNVGIYREGNMTEPNTYSMGKEKLLFEGDVKENPALKPGDVVYVPETRRPDWSKIFSFVSGIKLFKDLLGWK